MPPTDGKYIMSIPVKVLLERNYGDLAILTDDNLSLIMKFVPKDQTGFNALFAPRPATIQEIQDNQSVLMDLSQDRRVKCIWMAVRITEIGITKETYLRLRWLAAEGPQHPHRNLECKRWTMYFTYQILQCLIHHRVIEYAPGEYDLFQEMAEEIATDVTETLSYECWNGVHGWVHGQSPRDMEALAP